ncbi:putative DNA-binding transcriptional regulator YafY [Azonexus fungiphilus]|uniref:Putative DNA-binding transcriptional regulator YafY n=1 Tax=Azonexus fungiphilus TaxID=146940 RepID=A0A495WP20_9RHOO|nr:WYL domain-containing protein [Azonexus fungiphilus]RKT63077.1 putative DNA-binding transcriptional regulator YafY [Azonexus fungiphilus]
MSQTERFYKIDQLLQSNKIMSRQQLLDALQISWATLKRDLAFLKERFNAPIVYDRDAGGYRFSTPNTGPAYELPGLWFSAEETCALLTMHSLLAELEPGFLTPHVQPLLSRLEAILGRDQQSFNQVTQRIRLVRTGIRRKGSKYFSLISRALLERKRIKVLHYSREKDERLDRLLSPQRLVFYRNNWYLEAWCHARQALRRFSVDAFETVELLGQDAQDISQDDLNEQFDAGYGIYGGKDVQIAVLRFSEASSRWVADEEWHPNQVGSLDPDGTYTLRVPFSDSREIAMDILRLGHHVEVIEPAFLRNEVRAETERMSSVYANTECQ